MFFIVARTARHCDMVETGRQVTAVGAGRRLVARGRGAEGKGNKHGVCFRFMNVFPAATTQQLSPVKVKVNYMLFLPIKQRGDNGTVGPTKTQQTDMTIIYSRCKL